MSDPLTTSVTEGTTRAPPFFSTAVAPERLRETVRSYSQRFEGPGDSRAFVARDLARDYYQLVTSFFEYGWGQSFHFAPLHEGETVRQSLQLFEARVAQRLGLRPDHRVLDVGCGVGGPMRTVARVSGAHVIGITISPFQIERARHHNGRAGLSSICEVVEGDYNAMPFSPGSFDAAYDFEACCHAADRRGPFREVFRVLKPGGLFAGSDWCMTDRYHPGDRDHERIKLAIEKGNGLPSLILTHELRQSLVDCGFEVLEARDLVEAEPTPRPWYTPLAAGASVTGFRNSRAGSLLTHQIVRTLETLHLSPRGTVEVHSLLRLAQRALVEGGRTGIFTPMYHWLARKPGDAR